MFFPDWQSVAADFKQICTSYGLTGLFPLDLGLSLENFSKAEAALQIKLANIQLIKSSNGVIADITPFRGVNMDPGTAFEIGFAQALDKPVALWSHNQFVYIDRVLAQQSVYYKDGVCRDLEHMAVEDFGLADNLMITAGKIVHASFEQAALEMSKHLI